MFIAGKSKIIIIQSIFFCIFYSISLNAENFRIYKVKEKDTLTKISKEQLNDPSKWREFLKFNKIDNPNLIKPGLELKIPDSLAKNNPTEPPIARINKFTGIVKIQNNKNEAWVDVTSGTLLHPDDTIKTQEKSAVEVNYFDDPEIIINMRENSILKIKKSKIKSSLLSLGDAIFFVFRKKAGEDQVFKVVTPSAQAGVRGTVFGVSTDKNETSKYSCLSGVVDVTAQGKNVTLEKGYGTIVKKGEAPVEPFLLPSEIKVKLPAP